MLHHVQHQLQDSSFIPSAMLYILQLWSREVVTTTGLTPLPQWMLVTGRVW